ncbi:hypothetical protein QL285_061936 [Trifolium repens]|nr:hypothetical protein QL285_061936 [Trifolium repens]
MSREKTEWHAAIYLKQIKHFHQKVTRLSSQTNYRFVYEDSSMVVYGDSRKPAKDKDIKAIKNLEEKVDQLKDGHEKLPKVIQEKCCRYFLQYYNGHKCENCPEKRSTQEDKEASNTGPCVM